MKIPNLPRSGNYLVDREDDRQDEERKREYENYGTEREDEE